MTVRANIESLAQRYRVHELDKQLLSAMELPLVGAHVAQRQRDVDTGAKGIARSLV